MSETLARDIEALAMLFKQGGWDELRIETDAISLLFSNDPEAGPAGGVVSLPKTAAAPPASYPVKTAEEPASDAPAAGAIDPAWVAIPAPNLGTFYRSPKPGAAPFVEIGARVEPRTEICLLEVMKLFTSVKAGVAGIVRRINAADAQLVEGGQVLFYVEPA